MKTDTKKCRAWNEHKGLIFETTWGKACPHGQNERVMQEPTSVCEGCEFLVEPEGPI